MDFLLKIFYIMVIIYAVCSFIVVKKYAKKVKTIKDVIENDAQLQNGLNKETKKIVVMVIVNLVLLVLTNVIHIIQILKR